ncbi:MAG: helix-turn-helix domain-containing protein [Motiliproteus sp.]
MKNWKLSPKDSKVAKYIDCYWFLEKEPGDLGNSHPKLNPDTSAHLIIAADHHNTRYDQGSASQKGSGSHWIFPHRKTFVMDHSDPFLILGIKFKVGALYPLANSLPQFVLDTIADVDINSLMGLASFDSESLLTGAADQPQQLCDRLDELLASWLLRVQEDKHSELVGDVLPLLSNTPIADIGAALHRSQRTIERSFLRVTGLTLKQCHSMIRFEEMLNQLYKMEGQDINWVDFATQFEFSDQPHLIRYIKNTIGNTPGEYAKQRDLAIDTYGNFEFE